MTWGSSPQASALVAYYPFNGNGHDASGSGNDALIEGATLTSDRFNNVQSAYSFNGSSDYMEISNSNTLHLMAHFTLCAWVSPAGFYDGRCQGNAILSKGLTMDDPGSFYIGYSDNFDVSDCDRFSPEDEHFEI